MDALHARLQVLEAEVAAPDLWDRPEQAQALLKEKTSLEQRLTSIDEVEGELEDCATLLVLAEEEQDTATLREVEEGAKQLVLRCERLKTESLFTGEADGNACFVEIHAGAGGTESCDWAEMLLRMYLRWAEKHSFATEMVDQTPGEEAGIRGTTFKCKGEYAYGWARSESGVHRLVRLSPFDSANRRHTSFASVWVYPVVDEEIAIEIEEKDLRVDTFRSSGAGGQHVNTTDSAIRITHQPTGIVVQCQNNRSQHRNRAEAMEMLRARLYEQALREKEQAAQAENAGKSDNSWGNQIRSYVLHPYQMVKDLRTGEETGNTAAVLDGDLDAFMAAFLAQQAQGKSHG